MSNAQTNFDFSDFVTIYKVRIYIYTLFPLVQSTLSQEDSVEELGGMEVYNLAAKFITYRSL